MFLTSSFLQIPSHDGHPCLRLYPSHYRADSGLNPLETCAARRTYKTERCNLMLHRSVFIEMSGSVICGISFCNSFLQVLHPLRRMQLFLLHTEGSDCVVCIRHVVSVYICGCCCICIELVISALAARSATLSAVVTSPSLSTSPRSLASATLRVSARTAASTSS